MEKMVSIAPQNQGADHLRYLKDTANAETMTTPLPDFVPAKTHYPFFVMSVATFLEIDGLLPDHQTMLQSGDLVPHNSLTMKDHTMFISHQCTFTAYRLGRSLLLVPRANHSTTCTCPTPSQCSVFSCLLSAAVLKDRRRTSYMYMYSSLPFPQGQASTTQTVLARRSRRFKRF